MNSNIASEFLRNIEFCIWLCPWASSIHSNKKRTHIVAPPLEQESFNNSLDQEQSNCRNCSREHAILKSYISERTPTKCTTVDKEWTHNWFICQLNTIWKCSQKHNRDKSYKKKRIFEHPQQHRCDRHAHCSSPICETSTKSIQYSSLSGTRTSHLFDCTCWIYTIMYPHILNCKTTLCIMSFKSLCGACDDIQ